MKQHLRLDRKNGLYLAPAGHKGRGVFCDFDIKKGEILETTPSLVLNERATELADRTILEDYTFTVGALSKSERERAGFKGRKGGSAIIMGMMSYCNHDEYYNAEVIWEVKAGTLYYQLRATRNIPKHTEICTSYGEGWFDDRA